jgi:hypothetical protein
VRRLFSGWRHHVDVRVVRIVTCDTAAYLEHKHFLIGSVLQAMPVRITGSESRRVAGLQTFLPVTRHQHDLAEKYVHKLILGRMPMSLTRPSPGREPQKIDPELCQTACVSELSTFSSAAGLIEWRGVQGPDDSSDRTDINALPHDSPFRSVMTPEEFSTTTVVVRVSLTVIACPEYLIVAPKSPMVMAQLAHNLRSLKSHRGTVSGCEANSQSFDLPRSVLFVRLLSYLPDRNTERNAFGAASAIHGTGARGNGVAVVLLCISDNGYPKQTLSRYQSWIAYVTTSRSSAELIDHFLAADWV